MTKQETDQRGALLAVLRAMGDKTRLRALLLLGGGELCLCQIIELLDLAPSTVSRHMSVLRRAGLIEQRKQGRWHFYRLAGRGAPPVVRRVLRLAAESLADDHRTAADMKRCSAIRAKDPAMLTSCYGPTSACG